MIVVGIDNGLNGGLVAFCGKTNTIQDKICMPTKKRQSKSEVDIYKVDQWVEDLNLKKEETIVAIEEPLRHAKSSAAIRSMAISFGKLLALCELREWPYQCVQVRSWQNVMLGYFNKGQSKAKALQVATHLMPEENWLKSNRCSKPHDGLIDAFLIANYVWRKEKHRF
jgi:hypothetical protein